MKKIQSKMKALDGPQDNVDFSGAQWQITPNAVVGSGRNSNSFKFLCMYLLSATMEKIQSKMNLLDRSPWSNLLQIQTLSRLYSCPQYLKKRRRSDQK